MKGGAELRVARIDLLTFNRPPEGPTMQIDEPSARIGYQGTAVSRAKNFALKALLVAGGVVAVVSAFVVSLVFFAVGFAVVLTAGGYLWWKTRDLRKQLRARMQEQSHVSSTGRIIEGEVIPPARLQRDDRNIGAD
jgi:hypothetical protein